MKYGIFGDIHSNLEALEAVLEDMVACGVEQMVCLGDIVGYNANPAECLETVRSLGCPIVKGNHDEEASEDRDVAHFNPLAAESLLYSRRKLSEDQKSFLRALPLQLSIGDFTVVHASLDVPTRWDYVLDVKTAGSSFTYQRTQMCFCGHTHFARTFIKRGDAIEAMVTDKIILRAGEQYLVNVGAVGQPRDNDWRAAYGIYNTDKKEIEIRRVPYDLVKAQQKIVKEGLSSLLAERLANAV